MNLGSMNDNERCEHIVKLLNTITKHKLLNVNGNVPFGDGYLYDVCGMPNILTALIMYD